MQSYYKKVKCGKISNDLVWELSDMFNNLMVIPNVIALFALTNLVVKHADDPSRIPGKK